ncbi:MAG: matrixin family metalloprotease [Terriglobia bacterium]
MSFTKFGVFFSSVLLLGLASGAAWANDKIVSALNIPPGQPAPIIQDNGAASWPTNRNSAPSTLYEGAKWNSASAITWSLANSPGTTDLPFSGYMGSQYEALVQQAFETWAAASGLTFEKVADSSESDIRLGWGEFNTPSTRVVGHTMCQAQSGRFLPGVIIRLEDPLQDPLVAGTVGTLTYSGTHAIFYQVILHEIGHALGLADNNDPNSIMYYEATGANNTLARNDVAGIRKLYGSEVEARALQAAASAPPGAQMDSQIHPLSRTAESLQANQRAPASSVSPVAVNPSNSVVAANPSPVFAESPCIECPAGH